MTSQPGRGRGRAKGDQRRLTRAEQIRVTDYAIARRRDGYTTYQIAEACGLSDSTISEYIKRGGGTGQHVSIKKAARLPTLAPFVWADDQQGRYLTSDQPRTVDVPLAYTRSSTLAGLNVMLQQMRCDGSTVRFAHDVDDAETAGDTEWIRHAATVVNAASAYLTGLVQILDDAAHRQRVMHDPGFRDELVQSPRLRAVPD